MNVAVLVLEHLAHSHFDLLTKRLPTGVLGASSTRPVLRMRFIFPALPLVVTYRFPFLATNQTSVATGSPLLRKVVSWINL